MPLQLINKLLNYRLNRSVIAKVAKRQYRAFLLLTTVAIVFVLIGNFGWINFTQAETAYFYPRDCLGDWQNPMLAAGKPELKGGAAVDLFNTGNSAIYDGGQKQIFCGGFVGKIPKEAILKEIYLAPIAAMLSKNDLIGNNLAEADSEQVVEVVGLDGTTASSTVEMLATSTEGLSQDEEANMDYVIKPGSQSATQTESVVTAIADGTGGSEMVIATTTEDDATGALVDSSGQPDKFEVRYSLDGLNWQTLGSYNKDNFGQKLLLPVLSIKDLSSIQFAITADAGGQSDYLIMLEGLSLELVYDSGLKKDQTSDEPDLIHGNIETIKSFDDYTVIKVQAADNSSKELWLYEDGQEGQWKKLADGDTLDRDSAIGFKDDYIFWLSPGKQSIVAYSIQAQNYFGQTLETNNPAEHGLNFGEGKQVVLSDNDFTFERTDLTFEASDNDNQLIQKFYFEQGLLYSDTIANVEATSSEATTAAVDINLINDGQATSSEATTSIDYFKDSASTSAAATGSEIIVQ